MSERAVWNCPACARSLSSAYCPECGERPPSPRDLTLRGLLEQLFNALSSIDGRLLRSLNCLIRRPGELTAAYARGERMRYLGPIQLFLLANVLFFGTQSLTGANVFSSTLDSHLHLQDWSGLAQTLVANHLEAKRTTLELYAPVFDQAAVLHAKSLIILMTLPIALLLPVLFHRARQPFVAHAVFALHLYAFLLLLFCVLLLISAVDVLSGGAGLSSARMDNILSALNLAACAIYLHFATTTFYRARGAARILKVATLTLTVGATVVCYRFVTFLITLKTT